MIHYNKGFENKEKKINKTPLQNKICKLLYSNIYKCN